MLKKHWKFAAAAAFMTAAGIYYGLTQGDRAGFWVLPETGGQKLEEEFTLREAEPVSANGMDDPDSGKKLINPENGNNTENGTYEETAHAAGDAGEESGEKEFSGASPEGENSGGEADVPRIYVHVCGEVTAPGVYTLPEGSRAFEAVEAAGGFSEKAAQESINLAAPVQDGMRLYVPDRSEAETLTPAELERLTGQSAFSGSAASGKSPGGEETLPPVNINTAGKEELMTLNGIGESRADDIIRYRTQNGGFGSVEEIKNVPGIKDAMFQKIKDRITV